MRFNFKTGTNSILEGLGITEEQYEKIASELRKLDNPTVGEEIKRLGELDVSIEEIVGITFGLGFISGKHETEAQAIKLLSEME